MTEEEFRKILDDVQPGQGARVPYDVFETLFPPGEPHDAARAKAYSVARDAGLRIDNRPDDSAVWFYRDA